MNNNWIHWLITSALLTASTVGMAIEKEQPGGRAFTEAYSIARGGRLYDNWFAENEAGKPTAPNPAYPPAGVASGKKGADWRCKECHGWDYMGNRGAYGEGEHHTGFPGIEEAYRITPNQMARILSDKSHGYTPAMLSKQDIRDLTAFTARGLIPMDHYIERRTGLARGSIRRGKEYYQTVCAGCHGLDGKGEETPPLGAVARDNPWETLHKILNGQPGEDMPALRAFGPQSASDILTYMQRALPKK